MTKKEKTPHYAVGDCVDYPMISVKGWAKVQELGKNPETPTGILRGLIAHRSKMVKNPTAGNETTRVLMESIGDLSLSSHQVANKCFAISRLFVTSVHPRPRAIYKGGDDNFSMLEYTPPTK